MDTVLPGFYCKATEWEQKVIDNTYQQPGLLNFIRPDSDGPRQTPNHFHHPLELHVINSSKSPLKLHQIYFLLYGTLGPTWRY